MYILIHKKVINSNESITLFYLTYATKPQTTHIFIPVRDVHGIYNNINIISMLGKTILMLMSFIKAGIFNSVFTFKL